MQLMSEDLDTLWQYVLPPTHSNRSDGSQPHMVNIHFPRRTPVTVRQVHLTFSMYLSIWTVIVMIPIPRQKF